MANTIQSSYMTIPIFSGGNYDFWRFKRRIFISSQEHLRGIVNDGFTILVDTSTLIPAQKTKKC